MMGSMRADYYFAAGNSFNNGGPRPTPGGVDYASTDQRAQRWSDQRFITKPAPTSMLKGAPVNKFDTALGLRSVFPLVDWNSQLFAQQLKPKAVMGGTYGGVQLNEMSRVDTGSYALISKVRG